MVRNPLPGGGGQGGSVARDQIVTELSGGEMGFGGVEIQPFTLGQFYGIRSDVAIHTVGTDVFR